jgi:hypothetical protein
LTEDLPKQLQKHDQLKSPPKDESETMLHDLVAMRMKLMQKEIAKEVPETLIVAKGNKTENRRFFVDCVLNTVRSVIQPPKSYAVKKSLFRSY